MKRRVKLTEGDLHRIVKESVNRIIKENNRRTKRMIREFDDYDEFKDEDERFFDRKGQEIKVGSKVIWYDPEKAARDLKNIWTVWKMAGDIVYIYIEQNGEYAGEAEVFPEELKVVG